MFKKIKEYKYDLLVLCGLFIIFAILTSVFLFRQGNILIDCFGQNAYIPMEMLKGKVLYKDIIAPYGPFSYQFNAILMLIFGKTLNVVHYIGVINSLAILLLIYLISRNITGKKLSFTVSFLVMTICIFHFWITNYIFPYASAMTYSLSTFLASVLCSICYLKKSKPIYILLAFTFIAISVLIKLDFLFFIPVLMAIIVTKPVTKKYLALTAFTSSIIPILSWITLFAQGVRFNNILSTFNSIRIFAQSQAFRQFYTNNTGMFFNLNLLNVDLNMFFKVLTNLSIATGFLFLYLLILQKIFKQFKISLNCFASFVFTIPLYLFFLNKYYTPLFSNATFSWMAITTTIIFIVSLMFILIKIKFFESIKKNANFKDIKDKFQLISLKQRIFLLICIAAIISAMRCYFFINLQIFGTFVFPLILLVNIVFWADYLPSFLGKRVKFFDVEIWKKSCTISLIILGIIFSINYLFIIKPKSFPFTTSKGTYYLSYDFKQTFQQVVSYIEKHSDKNDTLLVMPRGLSINFFTGLSSNNKYYDFIPPTIEVEGENKIIQELKNTKPRFILITNENSSDWGAPYICQDYAFNICNYVYENYQYKETIGNDFIVKIFEIKK